jgi:hypothetical protein
MVQVVLCCFYVVLFSVIIYKSAFFRLPALSSALTILLFGLKVLSATLLWKIFVAHYPASDADVFFVDSKVLYDSFFDQPFQFLRLFFGIGDSSELQALRSKMLIWNNTYGAFLVNDSRTLIRLNALFRFLSFGHFYVHAVFMSFLSFMGLVYIYKLFFPYLRHLWILLLIACFLFPSVLFWSSTVLKEGIIFLGLGLLLYHCQCGLRSNYTFKNAMGMTMGMLLLVLVKIYVLFALCPALLANFWIANSKHHYVVLKYTATYSLCLLFLLIAPFVSPSLDFIRVLKNKQTDFINVAKGGMVLYHDSCYVYLNYDQREKRLEPVAEHIYKLKKEFQYPSFKPGGTDTVMLDGAADTGGFRVLYTYVPARSAFQLQQIEPSLTDILKNAPFAFFNTLFIPTVYSLQKAFAGLVLLENGLLLLFILVVLFFFSKKDFPLAVTFFCFSFVLILFTLIGLITPVLGAVVRYRIPGIPFLIIGFALILDEKKLIRVYQNTKANLFKKGAYLKK